MGKGELCPFHEKFKTATLVAIGMKEYSFLRKAVLFYAYFWYGFPRWHRRGQFLPTDTLSAKGGDLYALVSTACLFMAYTFFPSATTSGGGPFHFFQYEVTVGIISVDGFESRFALACQPKGTCKEEIHRLFTAKHINPRTFSDCTDLDSTMYYRLQNEAE